MEEEPMNIDELISEWAPDVRERHGEDYHFLKGSIAQIALVRKARAAAEAARAINELYNPTEHLKIKKEY